MEAFISVGLAWGAQSPGRNPLVRIFSGLTLDLTDARFLSDGKYVLTARQDRSGRLWDAATGKQLRLFPGYANSPVANAIFSPDGHSVLVGSFDGVAQMTPVDLEPLVKSVCARLLRDLTDEERVIYGIINGGPTCPQS